MEEVKRIPYGVSNFVEVVEQNQYYVDKTMYLPLLEKQPSNLFLIRPRRFGKSIFLSMLRAYYDIVQKEKYQKRLGKLWIGSQSTPLQGMFQDAIIREIKPWYDNYCFAKERLERDPKMFNCDMVLYYLRHYIGQISRADDRP